jgi:hypothetical protein
VSGTFLRTIQVFKDSTLSPQALSHRLAEIAREKRDELIGQGAAPATYETFVDGRRGATEETVKPDGTIFYQFNRLGQAAIYAMDAAVELSPVQSGDFVLGWTVAVDGRPWRGREMDIPANAEVLIVNPLPYARKIEVGAMLRMSVPPGILERVKGRVMARFPTLFAQVTHVHLPSVFGSSKYPTPYILRGRQRSVSVAHAARILAGGGRSVVTNRKDLRAGEQMTYPALSITMRL